MRIDLSEAYEGKVVAPLWMDVEWPEGGDGFRALFRLGFQSMRVPDLPSSVRIGKVLVVMVDGPVVSRQTMVVQRPSAPLVWDKTTYEPLSVGPGVPLTIGHSAAFLPRDPNTRADFAGWKDEVYSAVGLLSVLLDDRVGHWEVFDDFLIFDENGGWVGRADYVGERRTYLPFELSDGDVAAVESLAPGPLPPKALAAARWYLRAAQVGPAADGIPLLWTSLEALTQAEGRQVVRRVEEALRLAGGDPEQLDPTLGRIWGERARIVHFGETDVTELTVKGWYVLERVVRTLIRDVVDLQTDWPVSPEDQEPLRAEVRGVWNGTPSQTVWHEADV
jgi:hypothetical protein